MAIERIPVSGPWITQKEIDYVADAAANAWYQNANFYHKKFEDAFAAYLNVEYAIALPSCTSAIHLALAGLGISVGAEVIVPEITWIATAAPIDYVGAQPVFADIDPKTWCMSTEKLESLITKNTKAIIVVDLYGNIPDMDEICRIANKYNLVIIEDAAQAIGACYKGRKAGSLGDVGVFSFHGSKTMTTGEGGMLVTNNKNIYDRCCFLRDHGRDPNGKMFWNTEIAYKYKMSSMQAALGLAQLERIEELLDKKRKIFSWYKEFLGKSPYLSLNESSHEVENTYWMSTVILSEKLGLEKEEVVDYLSKQGIDTRVFFYPLSSLPPYQERVNSNIKSRNKYAYSLSPYGFNIPCSMALTFEEARFVSEKILELVAERTK